MKMAENKRRSAMPDFQKVAQTEEPTKNPGPANAGFHYRNVEKPSTPSWFTIVLSYRS